MGKTSTQGVYARITEVSVEKYRESIARTEKELVAIEEPLEIRIRYWKDHNLHEGGLSMTMRTPGQDQIMVLGFLYAEGVISSWQDVVSIEETKITGRDKPFPSILTVELNEGISFDLEALERNFLSTSSCGICGRTSVTTKIATTRSHALNTPAKLPVVRPSTILSLPERLHQAQTLFQHTGGIHASGLFDLEGRLIFAMEDVGRHNAMDKLIGQALRSDTTFPLSDSIVLFSGRVSYELVQKAIAAGIPIIAAVGAPSSLAVEMAQQHGITLIGFLRDARFNVYTGEAVQSS